MAAPCSCPVVPALLGFTPLREQGKSSRSTGQGTVVLRVLQEPTSPVYSHAMVTALKQVDAVPSATFCSSCSSRGVEVP